MYTGSQSFESMDEVAHCASIHKYKVFKATTLSSTFPRCLIIIICAVWKLLNNTKYSLYWAAQRRSNSVVSVVETLKCNHLIEP